MYIILETVQHKMNDNYYEIVAIIVHLGNCILLSFVVVCPLVCYVRTNDRWEREGDLAYNIHTYIYPQNAFIYAFSGIDSRNHD